MHFSHASACACNASACNLHALFYGKVRQNLLSGLLQIKQTSLAVKLKVRFVRECLYWEDIPLSILLLAQLINRPNVVFDE